MAHRLLLLSSVSTLQRVSGPLLSKWELNENILAQRSTKDVFMQVSLSLPLSLSLALGHYRLIDFNGIKCQ